MPETINLELPDDGVGNAINYMKKQIILHYLERTGGNVCQAALLMGIGGSSLRRMISALGFKGPLAEIRAEVLAAKQKAAAAAYRQLYEAIEECDGSVYKLMCYFGQTEAIIRGRLKRAKLTGKLKEVQSEREPLVRRKKKRPPAPEKDIKLEEWKPYVQKQTL